MHVYEDLEVPDDRVPLWRRTDPEADRREARFQQYLDSKVEYAKAITANGDVPWWEDADKLSALEKVGLTGIAEGDDIDRRRRLFERRYHRPDPPASIPIKSLAEIRGDRG